MQQTQSAPKPGAARRNALKAAVFTLLVALMLFTASEVLRDKDTTLSGIYSEPKDTVDAFFVGSSHVNSAIIPGVLWREFGISAFDVYSWSQSPWVAFHHIQEALKTQHPKVLVLDLYGMMYGHSSEMPEAIDDIAYKSSLTIDPGFNRLALLWAQSQYGIRRRPVEEDLNLVRYHSRWKYFSLSMFTEDAHLRPDYLRGYGPQLASKPYAAPPKPAGKVQSKPPYPPAALYLDKIVQLAKQKKMAVVFTMLPYVYNESELSLFQWLADYAKARDIPFLNYCLEEGQRIGFDYARHLSDPTHTSAEGALRITRDLGSFLAGKYTFRPLSQFSNGAALDLAADKTYRVFAVNKAPRENLPAFVQWLQNDKQHLLVVAGAGDLTKLPPQTKMALERLQLPQMEKLWQSAQMSFIGAQFAENAPEGDAKPGEVRRQWQLGAEVIEVMADSLAGVQMHWRGKPLFKPKQGVHLLFYDTVFERPLYHLTLLPDGTMQFHEYGTKTGEEPTP